MQLLETTFLQLTLKIYLKEKTVLWIYIRSLPILLLFVIGEMKEENYNSVSRQGSTLFLNEDDVICTIVYKRRNFITI